MSAAETIDLRGNMRANVFLGAVLNVAGSSLAVRIRDLSPDGARIDGKDLPSKGDLVRLKRGPHSVVAKVAWSGPDACGLRFSEPVFVREWTAYGSGHKGQQRVDDIVASVRAGAAAAGPVQSTGTAAAFDRLDSVEQIEQLARQLEQIAESFSVIPAVLDQGLAGLQGLDVATQKLRDLARRMRTG